MKRFVLSLSAACLLPFAAEARASFDNFLTDLKDELKREQIDPALLDKALGPDFSLEKKAVEKSRNQPEVKFTFDNYYNRLVSQYRIQNGLKHYSDKQDMLAQASNEFGVPKEVIVALWGIESAYGKLTGGFPVVRSLVTLAYDSHRKPFFRRELINALKIAQAGHIGVSEMEGSWAGAMGQCQFMPSSFLKYAVDGNNDGRKDIWNTLPDVFASAANYLKQNGWQSGEKWGQRVVLGKILPPISFPKRGLSESKSIAEWQKMGVYAASGKLNNPNRQARLFLPKGPSGRAYLVYDNFETILRWNNSSYFAYSVLTLADKIREGSA